MPETPRSTPDESRLKARPSDHHFRVAVDKQRVAASIMAQPKGSAERAAAFAAAVSVPHCIAGEWVQPKENTLRDWVRAAEALDGSQLVPVGRSDNGRARVLVTRAWDEGCGLSDDAKARIAAEMERTARGLVAKGKSDREVVRLCSSELRRMTLEAGSDIPKAELTAVFRLNSHWVARFANMRAVHQFDRDHKAFSDQHEFRVQRTLTRLPMEVLYGDVHHEDMNRPGFTGGQNSRRIALYGTDIKEEDREAVFP